MLNRVLKLVKLHFSEHSIAEDRCLIFMKEMNNISARSELTKAQVKYIVLGGPTRLI